MSRKYLNDHYCVRCSRKTACPYLKSNYDNLLLGYKKNLNVLDIGCGNGRNSEFMKEKGHHVISLDMVNDYGLKCVLGEEVLPIKNSFIDVVLCNYLMMFLNKNERKFLIKEIKRVAHKNCIIMVELYPAKDSYAKTEREMIKIQKEIFNQIGWFKFKYSQGRFMAINVYNDKQK